MSICEMLIYFKLNISYHRGKKAVCAADNIRHKTAKGSLFFAACRFII